MTATAHLVELGWTHDETDYRLICLYVPGTPARTHGEPGDRHEAEQPELVVMSVREDKSDGVERPDLVEVAERETKTSDLLLARAEDDVRERKARHG